jgi:hypothetical protein
MPQNFVFPQRDQPLLLPVDMRGWLPEDDLVFVVLDAWPRWIWAGSAAGTGLTGTGGRSSIRR